MTGNLKILVADDHAIVREGLRQLIATHPTMQVVGEAVDGKDVIHKAKQLRPDVILLDIAMPGLNGLEVLPLLKEAVPETKVVILSMYDKETYVHQALSAGARGYILKTDSGRDVTEAILLVAAGAYYLSAKLNIEVIKKYLDPLHGKNPASAGYDRLTEREQQIFRLIVEGHATKDIAALLNLSPRTVEKHRSNIASKLDIHDVMTMLRYAVQIGVVDPELWARPIVCS